MLELDIGQLERKGRARIDVELPADHPLWQGTELQFRQPVHVHLDAQRAGHDVVVLGRIEGRIEIDCRRCLLPVESDVDEVVSLVFRPGLSAVDAERQEMCGLPERVRVLDLSGPILEHVLLGVPRFAVCVDGCRGLCPRCGTNLNQAACNCAESVADDRWAPLRKLKLD